MAFNPTLGRVEYIASTGQTSFPYSFKIFFNTDVKVYLTPAGQPPNDVNDLLTLTSDYTVSINGDLGGTITLVNPASTNDSITIIRELSIIRLIEYQINGDLLANTLNADQEYQTYLTLDQASAGNRFISLPNSAQGVNTTLPDVAPDSYLRWNNTGDAIENDTTIPDSVSTTKGYRDEAEKFAFGDPVGVGTITKGAKQYSEDANISATNAQLEAWNAEAEKLTADSYATEPENVFVKVYTSNGDGTFNSVNTTEYSSLHYATKATSGGTARTSARNTVISSPNGVLLINGANVELQAGNIISYAEGTDASSGDLDSIEDTVSSVFSLILGVKNYLYIDKGLILGSTDNPLVKTAEQGIANDLSISLNTDVYDVAEGLLYQANGVGTKSRVYLGEVTTDGAGAVIPSTLVEYPVAHLDVASMQVYGGFDLGQTLINETANRQSSDVSGATNVYTNTSGKPITLYVSSAYASGASLNIFINGEKVIEFSPNVSTTTAQASMVFPVPAGFTYSVYSKNGLLSWYELK